jgi:thioredoxin-related protein
MNKFIGFFIVSFFMFQTSYSQEIAENGLEVAEIEEIVLDWIPTYKEALRKAKKEKKPVLIYFTGSDWCGPCKILDNDLFHTEKFKSLSDKDLVLLEVDIPRRRDLVAPKKMKENLYLQKKYRVKAFPTLMMVNHRGRKLAEKKGYVMSEYYYPFFQSVIRKY